MESLPVIPFRWDVTRRERLGALAEAPPGEAYREFREDLRRCCAGVLSASPDCDLFFVGRSPESLFDYLSGVFAGAAGRRELRLVLFSMRDLNMRQVRRHYAAGLEALEQYFHALGLDPASLAARERPVALVDLVYSGATFDNLVRLLYEWALRERADWRSVRRKLRIVGVVASDPRPRPSSTRWQQARPFVRHALGRGAIRNVAIPARLWNYLGDDQPKVAESYPPHHWGRDRAAAAPVHGAWRWQTTEWDRYQLRAAVRLAHELYRSGRARGERDAFIAALAGAGGLRHAALRALALGLRRTAGHLPRLVKFFTAESHPPSVGSPRARGPTFRYAAAGMPALVNVIVACSLLILGSLAPASAATPESGARERAMPDRVTPDRAAATPTPPSTRDLEDLDRDDAAAEAAVDRGDFAAALRYMDFFGHEEEEFAAAMLEYGRDQRKLRTAVVDSLGERAWRRAAAALGVPHHRPRGEGRSARREGDVVYVRNGGAEFESPYVKVGGVWKVSVRDILLTAIRARFGPKEKVEEADLHVLAGKMAKVIRGRSKGLSDLAEAVRTGHIRTDAALREAAENLRRGPARPKE